MLNTEENIDKIYFTIGEVAAMLNENTSLIRFWEKEFDILKPHKNKKGNRLFTRRDVDYLSIIHRLVKTEGYTLDGARRRLKDKLSEEEKTQKVITSLNTIKQLLLEVKEML